MLDNDQSNSHPEVHSPSLILDHLPFPLLSEDNLRLASCPGPHQSATDPSLSHPPSSTSTQYESTAQVVGYQLFSKTDDESMEQVNLSTSPHLMHASVLPPSAMAPDRQQTATPAPTYHSEFSSPHTSCIFKDLAMKPESLHTAESTSNEKRQRPRIHERVSSSVKREGKDMKEAVREVTRFVKTNDWKQTAKNIFKRKYWAWWLMLVVIITLSSLLSSYHTKIALALKPYQQQIRSTSWAWIIPTVLLIIVSFPPLFGHELIILVVGMIWGTWVGFAIAAGGTFLGEIATYFAFKYMISNKSQKIEERSVTYASLAKLMREGGVSMVILVRASAIPGHVCTAMQATIGVRFWMFTIACFVTLPKQFALVYVGVLLGEPSPDTSDPLDSDPSSAAGQAEAQTKFHHAISAVVFLVTAFFTIISAYVVWMRMRKIRPTVQEEFRKRDTTIGEPDAVPLTEKAVHSNARILIPTPVYLNPHPYNRQPPT